MMNVFIKYINYVISVCLGVIDGIKRVCNGEAGTIQKIGSSTVSDKTERKR